jgi:hypothetical protein
LSPALRNSWVSIADLLKCRLNASRIACNCDGR